MQQIKLRETGPRGARSCQTIIHLAYLSHIKMQSDIAE